MLSGRQKKKAEARKLAAYENDIGPYHIILAALIHDYAETIYYCNQAEEKEEMNLTLLPGSKAMRDFLLGELNAGRVFQPTLQELLKSLQERLDRAWKIRCTSRLQQFFEGLQSPDDLIGFEAKVIRPATLPTVESEQNEDHVPVDPQTEFGLFLRSVSLAFMLLLYEAVCGLCKDLNLYAQQGQAQGGRNPKTSDHRFLERRVCLQRLLESKIKQIENQGVDNSQLEELSELADFLEKRVPLRQVQMLKHLIALQYNDHESAIQALHSYFDHPAKHFEEAAARETSTQFQAALLNLGSCHTTFGRTQEAMVALNECARVAQQVNDDVCLQHNVAQLCRLQATTSTTGGPKREADWSDCCNNLDQLHRLLQRCHKRSRELKLPHLEAYARSAMAQFRWKHKLKCPETGDAERGAGAEAAGRDDVIQSLRDVQELYYITRLAGSIPVAEDCVNSLGEVIPKINVSDLCTAHESNLHHSLAGMEEHVSEATEAATGTALLFQAAACFQAGQRVLGESYVKSFLTSYSQTASKEDKALAVAQLAMSCCDSRGPDAALQFLEVSEKSGFAKASKKLTVAKLCILHTKALNTESMQQAEEIAQDIIGCAGPVASLNADLRAEGERCRVENLIKLQRYEQAEALAREIFGKLRDLNLQGQSAQMLILLAKLHLDCNAAATALRYAESALELTEALSLDLLVAESKMYRAQCCQLLGVGGLDGCLSGVLPLMPLIKQSGNLRLQGLLHWTIASLYLQQPSLDVIRTKQERICMHLAEAERCYKQTLNVAMLSTCSHATAVLHASLGNIAARDSAARDFLNTAESLRPQSIPLASTC